MYSVLEQLLAVQCDLPKHVRMPLNATQYVLGIDEKVPILIIFLTLFVPPFEWSHLNV